MNSQELRNLQEAYMKVVMNEGKKPLPMDKMINKLSWKSRERSNPKKDEEKLRKQMNVIANTIFAYSGGRAKRNQKEQVDLYDIILSHLLDEGYATTEEAAGAIMVNMSEEWRGEIVEGYKKFPAKKIANKIDRMYNDPNIDNRFGKDAKRRNEMMRVSSHMKGEVHPLIRSESPKKSKAKESENKAKLKYKK
jgi:hypothetical protein